MIDKLFAGAPRGCQTAAAKTKESTTTVLLADPTKDDGDRDEAKVIYSLGPRFHLQVSMLQSQCLDCAWLQSQLEIASTMRGTRGREDLL